MFANCPSRTARLARLAIPSERIRTLTDESMKDALSKTVTNILAIPDTHPIFTPSLGVVPLQIFAYYVALQRGCDIDKPRNLAKSVTVE